MSTMKLNELLARAVVALQDDGLTLVTLDDVWAKPWLPESYWREKAEQLLAEANARAVLKGFEQARLRELENLPAKAIMAEWEDELPTLLGDNEELRIQGWGVQRMRHVFKPPQRPHQGNPQPTFPFECYQCGRPITDDGRDHAGKYTCDLAVLDPEMIEDGEYYDSHQAKPWHGEEEDDD